MILSFQDIIFISFKTHQTQTAKWLKQNGSKFQLLRNYYLMTKMLWSSKFWDPDVPVWLRQWFKFTCQIQLQVIIHSECSKNGAIRNCCISVRGHSSKFSKRNYIFPLHLQKLVTYFGFGQISPDFAFLIIRGVQTGRTGLNN